MSHVTRPDDSVNLSKSFDDCGDVVTSPGLTKREYFAAMAMQGLSAFSDELPSVLAITAVSYADALIAELNK